MKYLMLAVQLKITNYDTKINELETKLTDHNHDKYITTPEFKKLTAEKFATRLRQAKANFDNKLISLHQKIKSNKTKHLLVKKKFKS